MHFLEYECYQSFFRLWNVWQQYKTKSRKRSAVKFCKNLISYAHPVSQAELHFLARFPMTHLSSLLHYKSDEMSNIVLCKYVIIVMTAVRSSTSRSRTERWAALHLAKDFLTVCLRKTITAFKQQEVINRHLPSTLS